MAKVRFSLKSLCVAQLVVVLVLGWLGDHWYQTSRYDALVPSAQLGLKKEKLTRAIADTRNARNAAEYTEASNRAIGVMQWSIKRGRNTNYMIATYVEAMRVPDWPERRAECFSMQHSASAALAAIGPDALPVICGLLNDEDPKVRYYGAQSLYFLTKGGNAHVTPLPKQEIVKYLPAVKEARARECDSEVAGQLDGVLRKLSGP